MRIEDLFAIKGSTMKDRFNNPQSNLGMVQTRRLQPARGVYQPVTTQSLLTPVVGASGKAGNAGAAAPGRRNVV